MYKTYVLTLDGTAQRLNSVLSATLQGPGQDQDVLVDNISMQAGSGNANPIFVGGDSAIASTTYGARIPAPDGGEPFPPLQWNANTRKMRLSHVYVKGTNAEKLHVSFWE